MAGSIGRPSRVAGMHFFNPVHKMKLVEIVRALESSDATLAAVEAVSRQMGKETVLVRESPGFITTRVNASIGNEAFYMLMEGVASARDIDKALKLGLNHPMGPFELGRSRRPRHPAQHPRIPAQVDGGEVPAVPAARAVREGGPARQEGR